MAVFKINMAGADALSGKLAAMTKSIQSKLSMELQDGANNIAAEAKQRAPGDQGILRNEIYVQTIDSLHYNVVSGADYSPYVEFGTRTLVAIPPGLEDYAAQFIGPAGANSLGAKEAIFAWCARQGIDQKAWYAIYISIMAKGTKPQPFFFPAVERQKPLIISRVQKVLQDL
jgi:HK97 gp10 family phage protein